MRVRHRLPLRVFLVCLALGALATIAIAWGCVLQIDPKDVTFTVLEQAGDEAATPAELDQFRSHPIATRFSDNQLAVGLERQRGAQRRVATAMPYWRATTAAVGSQWVRPFASNDFFDVRTRCGWPALAMEGRRTFPRQPAPEVAITGQRPPDPFQYSWLWRLGSIDAFPAMAGRSALFPRYLLPLKPLWPGFAINTLLYTAIAWLLLFGPLALRRLVLRRRGRCERCGYPRGPSDRCSECGEIAPRRVVEYHAPHLQPQEARRCFIHFPRLSYCSRSSIRETVLAAGRASMSNMKIPVVHPPASWDAPSASEARSPAARLSSRWTMAIGANSPARWKDGGAPRQRTCRLAASTTALHAFTFHLQPGSAFP